MHRIENVGEELLWWPEHITGCSAKGEEDLYINVCQELEGLADVSMT